jgi:hypothetical protein
MKPINNKMRLWILGGILVIISVLVWRVHVWSPLQDHKDELDAELSLVSQERDRLTQRLERLSDTEQDHRKMEETLAQFAGLVVQGNSPEEVSARTQLWVQEFLENQGLSLKAYKGLSPSKWRDYPLSRVQFQLGATMQGLSDLLENFENMETAVRIEKLGVNYRRSRENDLLVSLDLSTLFVEGLKE